MKLVKYFGVALESILAHKLRAFLTMLGIIIGVTAVLTIMGIGAGAAADITGQIESQGTNLLTISGGGSASRLTLGDVAVMADPNLHPELGAVVPEYSGSVTLLNGDATRQSQVIGTTASYAPVRNLNVQSGRFFSEEEVREQRRVAVLGWNLVRDLFRGIDPVGNTVRMDGEIFQIVGVLEQTGGAGFGSNDDRAFVPISVAQSRLFSAARYRGDTVVSGISVQVIDRNQVAYAERRIEQTLRLRHGLGPDDDNDFTIFNQANLLELVGGITTTLTVFLGGIGAISLLVGGIGIMNIMLVSVTERTREIGLRKALGAQDSDILMQFVVEALVLCVLGGAIGSGISYGLAFLISRIPGFPFEILIQPTALMLALGVSTACGFVFGLYPAMRATRLDPIEALRYE
jgi:putative ABC transport system permease protein